MGCPTSATPDSDDDGALDADEVDVGLDPRSVDSDLDGCGDVRELVFESCDPAHVVLEGSASRRRTGSLTLTVSSDIPAGLSDVTLVWGPDLQGDIPVRFDVVAFDPATSGTFAADGRLATLNPGAHVELSFTADVFPIEKEATSLYEVSLESESEGVIASGGLLLDLRLLHENQVGEVRSTGSEER